MEIPDVAADSGASTCPEWQI